jgi:hypothetical protein
MYFAIIVLTMLVMPVISIGIEQHLSPLVPVAVSVGRWFVFWAVGVRLGLAGIRQIAKPQFTAREIFKVDDAHALPIVRELGIANLAAAVVGLLSLAVPSFVLPAAIWSAIFYMGAGAIHVATKERSRKETLAMVSDWWAAAVLAAIAMLHFMPLTPRLPH